MTAFIPFHRPTIEKATRRGSSGNSDKNIPQFSSTVSSKARHLAESVRAPAAREGRRSSAKSSAKTGAGVPLRPCTYLRELHPGSHAHC